MAVWEVGVIHKSESDSLPFSLMSWQDLGSKNCSNPVLQHFLTEIIAVEHSSRIDV